MTLLGIDLGTSSVKALALDVRGRTLARGSAAYPVTARHAGWAESDPADWWNATVTAVHEALSHIPREVSQAVSAIGLSGQMHGVVLVDADGQPLRSAVLWPDTRAEDALAAYRALPDPMLSRLANPLAPGMAGPLLRWLQRHEPETYQAARWAFQPKDWLRYMLTGTAATDPSDASATLLYDLPGDHWADDVIAALGLRRTLLPPLLPSAAVAGPFGEQVAASFGLPAGIVVATGAGDTAAAALGAGLISIGPVQLTLGTGAQAITLRDTPAPDPRLRTHRYRAAEPDRWYAMAAVQNAGLALNWVRGALGASWEALYASANMAPPGPGAPYFVPYLTHERAHHTGPADGGSFQQLRLDHTRGDMLRAALEGVAFSIREALEALDASTDPDVPATSRAAVRLAGGGSVHHAWRQMLADALGRALLIVDAPDASARGAALLAGIATGVWADATATADVAPGVSGVVHPDPTRAARYDTRYARFRERSGADVTALP